MSASQQPIQAVDELLKSMSVEEALERLYRVFKAKQKAAAPDAAAALAIRATVEQYLAMELQSAEKHEYLDGEVVLMAGASFEHNLVVANLIGALRNAFSGKCTVLPSDMRPFIDSATTYTYADASLVCGPAELTTDKPAALRNPTVLFGVLSESTERYDRGKKFAAYRSLPSATDYVLLAQDRVFAEHYHRESQGAWVLREVTEGLQLQLSCGKLALNEVYRGVLPLMD
ncbi:MAG TPA: Uma2 family endonuclease [Pseudomonadota bacterium]|nr:Uma2 family endonuclease [Pseudomonadota bacterium]